jgi:hypothetical protein
MDALHPRVLAGGGQGRAPMKMNEGTDRSVTQFNEFRSDTSCRFRGTL